MKTLITILTLTFCLSASAQSLVEVKTDLAHDNVESASENKINYSTQWTNSDQLSSNLKKFLGIKDSSESKVVLLSSFNFYIPKSFSKFGKKYFDNMTLLEKLSGMKYEKGNVANTHKIKFKPHPLKTITADSRMKIPSNTSLYEDLFFLEKASEQMIVHQTVENFSDYLDRTDIITQLSPEDDGTRFVIYSIAILNSAEGQSSMLGITKKGMLMKLKDQMELTPGIFSSTN